MPPSGRGAPLSCPPLLPAFSGLMLLTAWERGSSAVLVVGVVEEEERDQLGHTDPW